MKVFIPSQMETVSFSDFARASVHSRADLNCHPLNISAHQLHSSSSATYNASISHLYRSIKWHWHKNNCSNGSSSKDLVSVAFAVPDIDNCYWEKPPTPLLDTVEAPIHLKNLSLKELKQLAEEVRSEIIFTLSKTGEQFRSSLGVVDLTIALHHTFHTPMDRILWDSGEQTYPHKILTGRRPRLHSLRQTGGISGFTCRFESDYDAFGAGHGCNSVSAGLGMAAGRDLKGMRNHVIAVIHNGTMTAGQAYEAMCNAGYLNSNLIVILNDSRNSLQIKAIETPKIPISVIASTLSKLQSSKSFRELRETAKGITKKFGGRMHDLAAKVDEYARGMIGPSGSTLVEELGLYYIGPVDGHNIGDLVNILKEVKSTHSLGPVFIHVVTEEGQGFRGKEMAKHQDTGTSNSACLKGPTRKFSTKTYADYFVEALIAETEKDKDIVAIHTAMGGASGLDLFAKIFPDRCFSVGMAEQHAVTFAAGLACEGLKPFCVICSSFLQRAYDQMQNERLDPKDDLRSVDVEEKSVGNDTIYSLVIHDVDLQKLPVRFAIDRAGLVGTDGPSHCGAFDVTYMACLPNMIVMAPSDETELFHMVATSAAIDDRPICFRYPRGYGVGVLLPPGNKGEPLEIGKGNILAEGSHVALLGYGVMVQNCLRAHTLLAEHGIYATVANARFCKPLDIDLIRQLAREHHVLITVEEGSVGGFGSHVVQFMALDGLLDGTLKWRPIVLPDSYIEHGAPRDQMSRAGLTGNHIAATALNLLGRTRDALEIMC